MSKVARRVRALRRDIERADGMIDDRVALRRVITALGWISAEFKEDLQHMEEQRRLIFEDPLDWEPVHAAISKAPNQAPTCGIKSVDTWSAFMSSVLYD